MRDYKEKVHAEFIGLRLPDELSQKIREQAKREGMSISDLLRKIAQEYVDEMERMRE